MGGSVQALVSWFTPHNDELVCFAPATVYEDPIEARPLDEHRAETNRTDGQKGFQLYLPHGSLCNKPGVTSGAVVNVVCDPADSGSVFGRFGSELDGGTCWAVVDVHAAAGCSDEPAPPTPREPVGVWKGSVECVENCGYFKKPGDFPKEATFTMTIDKCPSTLDYSDGSFVVDGWDAGSFTVGFLNVNNCASKRFSAELYWSGEGNAGEISLEGGRMDADR